MSNFLMRFLERLAGVDGIDAAISDGARIRLAMEAEPAKPLAMSPAVSPPPVDKQAVPPGSAPDSDGFMKDVDVDNLVNTVRRLNGAAGIAVGEPVEDTEQGMIGLRCMVPDGAGGCQVFSMDLTVQQGLRLASVLISKSQEVQARQVARAGGVAPAPPQIRTSKLIEEPQYWSENCSGPMDPAVMQSMIDSGWQVASETKIENPAYRPGGFPYDRTYKFVRSKL